MIKIKKYCYAIVAFFTALSLSGMAHSAVNPDDLLSPEQAFIPTVQVTDKGVLVDFKIADGYYLYQNKIGAQSSNGADSFAQPVFSKGKEKEDEFFGKQVVYLHNGQVAFGYKKPHNQPYELTLSYQGCAEVGVCYPPVETKLQIQGNGVYQSPNEEQANGNSGNSNASLFVKKPQGAENNPNNETTSVVTNSSAPAETTIEPTQADNSSDSKFKLSWETLETNLVAFFVGGLLLSFTACMYPLIPIVSSIIVGDKSGSKKRAFTLSFVYVQGLALTYTLVGVLAGLTGALLTVWLQQAWVVLGASGLMVLLALSMFGLFNIQLPNSLQSYFQNQSSKLSGGKIVSVFVMGMLSALIVGPCVAPPLAAALGYIGKTGDAVLGGLALYTLAIGTGVPLIVVGTFGGHVLPRAGAWMNGIKSAFGFILLAAAVYLATAYLPYWVVIGAYTLLLVVPAGMMLRRVNTFSGSLKTFVSIFSAILLLGGIWFAWQSSQHKTTLMHEFLTLHEPNSNTNNTQNNLPHHKFTSVAELENTIQTMFKDNPNEPVLLDFYADWCVSCKEMEARTFNQPNVQAVVPMHRLVQIDVTANTPEHQALLKKYGLFGPPGLFVLKADGSHGDGLIGFAKPDEFIEWYQSKTK